MVRATGAQWRLGGVRSLFIQTEETPNPASLKFLPGKEVLPEEYGSAMEFRGDTPTNNSPLARLLMRVNGVSGVFLSNDFVTISKSDQVEWAQLKPEVFATIMDFYAADKPAVTGPLEGAQGDEYPEEESEIVELIKELLEQRIRPMVQEDGGDIFFKGFDEETGIVSVQLAGSCAGCPSSTVTLKNGVENMLMHYIPEVTGVHSIGELDESPDVRVLQYRQDDII
ncbi:NFU1 iron-sulfur cluster scaffold-like, mitochondrial [Hondaea fermentalgiana]|uniref:NFU1 iron-sulfur cluster scaffold-like, mitochondrial n=1 Tax=Hondaea fermentalgiana TaxID=2315210 RepID=A0A2R5G4Y0_9STRA|nr:NFU1 iron-sulfur cluster scaffold-like, mitochondrial [Hondaea fermentalgiana]|eukprot:GBG25605.1 NFU1 iron-sulfur cluster scaffold-like, mitochondrial [Hondaea fermentalgiana]